MVSFSSFYLVPSVTALIIVLLSFFRSRRHRSVMTFAVLNLTVVGWNLGEFVANHCADAMSPYLWLQISKVSSIYMITFCLHFILTYTGDKNRYHKILLGGCHLFSLFLVYTIFRTDLFMDGMEAGRWGVFAVPGPFYRFYVCYYILAFLYAFVILGRYTLQTSSRAEKNRSGYLLIFGGLAPVLGITHFTYLWGMELPPLGHIGTFLFSVVVFYIIYRYQIMDIRIAFRKGLIITFTVAVLSGLYLLLVLSTDALIHKLTGQDNKLVTYFSVMIFAVLFQPFQRKIHEWGNRILFPVRFHYRKVLEEFSNRISSFTSIDTLFQALLSAMQESMTYDSAVVYLWNEDFERFDKTVSVPHERNDMPAVMDKNGYYKEILNEQRLQHRYRFEVLDHDNKKETVERLHFLRKLNMSLCFPIRHKNEFIGVLFLGHRKIYTLVEQEDLEIIASIAARAAEAVSKLKVEKKASEAEHLAQVGKLSSTIAHEIKNPLGAIKSSAQLLIDGRGGPAQLEVITEESERLNRILLEYLDFSRPQKLGLEKVDWNEFIKKVLKLYGASEDRIEFVPSDENVTVMLDPDKIRQVVINLLSNAERASGDGGKVVLNLYHQKEYVCLKVEDSGQGFSEQALKSALEPFFTTFEDGTGLGLAIVRKIVKEHRGAVALGNREEGGAWVEVRLPI